MSESIKWLQVRSPADFNLIRGFIEKNRALGIEGYERLADKTGDLCFMLGYQDETTGKATFVAGVRTQIWEFGEKMEDRVRKALHMERVA